MRSSLLEEFASYLSEKPLDLERYGLDGVFREWARESVDPDVIRRAVEASGLEDGHPGLYEWLPFGVRDEFASHLEMEGHIRQVVHDWGHDAPSWMTLSPVSGEPETVVAFHLTNDPMEIVRNGFTKGRTDYDTIAVTRVNSVWGTTEHRPSEGPGLNFGLPETSVDRLEGHLGMGKSGYGEHAVAVLIECLRVWHGADGEEQLVFDGRYIDPTVIIPVTRHGNGYVVDEGEEILPVREAIAQAAAAARQARKDHQAHSEAADETGYWGKQGAGCLAVARSTGRVLIGFRSEYVMEPFTWGTFGGAMDEDLTPEQMARKELRQEAGYTGAVEMVPLYVYEAPEGTFAYHNFAAVVDEEFEPIVNWEHEEARWFDIEELLDNPPDELHYGLENLLADMKSVELLRSLSPSGRKPR
jgi:8-oxo-dGTP pyrophosphatase MutT (NUDIX family)